MSLRISREGFEGFGLHAEPRPAECRRIPRSPPKLKMPLSGHLSLLASSRLTRGNSFALPFILIIFWQLFARRALRSGRGACFLVRANSFVDTALIYQSARGKA